MIFLRTAAVLTLAAVSLVACGTDKEDSPGSSSGGGGKGACATDSRKDIYTAGLSKQGTGLTVKVMDATPAPPSKGTNVMTFQVLDAAGKGVTGATVAVTPFMPDHGHGSAVVPIVKDAGDGKYTVEKIYLSMAGLWTLTVKVEMPGQGPQEVSFAFCLDG